MSGAPLPPFDGDGGPYLQTKRADTWISGETLEHLVYTGPAQPAESAPRRALLLAYRSEVALRYAVWAARHLPARLEAGRLRSSFTPAPLTFRELRLRLPHFYFDEDEGLPSAEPLFTDLRARLFAWHDLLLFGPPGSGKTTTLQRLAFDLARDGLNGDEAAPLPILADLGAREPRSDATALLYAELASATLTDANGVRHPLPAHRMLADLLPELLAGARLALLWDGLDEVASGSLAETKIVLEALRSAAVTRVLNVFTCRAERYPPSSVHTSELHVTIKQAAIQPLDAAAIEASVSQRLGADQGRALLARLARPAHAELARNPLLLYLLCEVYAAYGELPSSLTSLLAAGFALRLATAGPDTAALQAMLADLAFAGLATFGRGSVYSFEWAVNELNFAGDPVSFEGLARLGERAGLLARLQNGAKLRFSHALARDYFAAQRLRDILAELAEPVALRVPEAQHLRFTQSERRDVWLDSLLMLPGLESTRGPILPLLRELLGENPLTAAQGLIAGAAAEPRTADMLRSIALQQLGTPALPFRRRLGAGQALGLLGDPRAPVRLDEWRTTLDRRAEDSGAHDGYWRHVQGGTYQIGGRDSVQAGVALELAGFWLARLPLTVAQYMPFVPGGYSMAARAWWPPSGWAWRVRGDRQEPDEWDDPAYTAANQPVVGVSWYEASAFCAWLSAYLADALPAGYVIRLPTEAEWEAAACFDATATRRVYPWGDAPPTIEHLICRDSRLDQPAPVGCCPAGAAACGALDLLGNIEEWCANRFGDYPARGHFGAVDPPAGGAIQLGPLDAGHVAVRGGWWAQQLETFGGANRFWYYASATNQHTGFRVVLAPAFAAADPGAPRNHSTGAP